LQSDHSRSSSSNSHGLGNSGNQVSSMYITPKKSLTLIVILSLAGPALGQTNENHPEYSSVMAVILDWTTTMETGDLAGRKELTIDGAMIQRLVQQEDGSFQLNSQVRDIDPTQTNLNIMVERYWNQKLLIEEQLAVFMASYDFWINGEFSHCGTDVFDLVKIDSDWKLGNMMYTIQRTDCPPSPLGELAKE
jgi:hypothetical protein